MSQDKAYAQFTTSQLYLLSSVTVETVTQTAPRPHPFPCSICGLLLHTWNLFYCLKNLMDPFTVT